MAYTTIDKPDDYFNTLLYTGNGSTQSITGVGFQPDWVWIKNRTSAEASGVFDAVRGVTKMLSTQNTDAETTDANSLTAFGGDGFSVGSSLRLNQSTNNIVSWNWLANGAGVSNTAGSITSTVSANTTSGFSIVSYTGTGANATVGHGLGVAPDMIITKVRANSGNNWAVFHKSLGAGNIIWLNLTNAVSADTSFWNNTTPTSSVFSIGTQGDTNRSANTIIAYCFAEKKGFSKFGSYTGNGNADGPFVYTGFKPAFVLVDNKNQADDWYMFDNKRSSFNQVQANLKPNANAAEASSTSYAFDFLSNGFKLRSSTGAVNNNTDTLIYMAFAENPFVTSTSIPTTAR
jgi:hypothetical protein